MKLLSFVFILIFCLPIGAKTAYVNFDQVLEKTKQGRLIRDKFKKELERRRGQIQKRDKKLQEEQMKLNSEASLLSDTEKRNRVQKIQQQALELQRSLESNERELEEYRNSLVANMEKNMRPILDKMAKKQGLTKVKRMTKDILWVPKSADITSQVIQAYNKKHK